MKPQLVNGFIVAEALFESAETNGIDYAELGLKEPDYFGPDTCEWKKTAIRASAIVAVNEQINSHDPSGKYCKVETERLIWSLRCDMMDIIALI